VVYKNKRMSRSLRCGNIPEIDHDDGVWKKQTAYMAGMAQDATGLGAFSISTKHILKK
jgi:hypothetical protein